MANWSILKAAIADIIKTNNNQEITGANLQSVLNNIINSIGENAQFADVATPDTNPGEPDGNVFYLASQDGIYSNFGGIVVSGEMAIIHNKTGNWVKIDTGIATKEKILELENRINREQEFQFTEGGYLNSSGSLVDNVAYKSTPFIETHQGDTFYYTGTSGSATECVIGYSSSKDMYSILLSGKGVTYTREEIIIPQGVYYIRACANISKNSYFAKLNNDSLDELNNKIVATNEDLVNLRESLVKESPLQVESFSVIPETFSISIENKDLYLNPIPQVENNIAIYANTDYDYLNEYNVNISYGTCEVYMIPIVITDNILYAIRFIRSECALYKLNLNDRTSGIKVTSIDSQIKSYNSGDKISHSVQSNKNLIVYINGVLAFTYDMSNYINSGSDLIYGMWIGSVSSSWTSKSTLILENIASTLDVIDNITKSISVIENDVEQLKSNNIRYDNRFIHFSFDDVILCFKDINETNPSSIFDNEFFGWMKTIHEKYGTCFSCYCFYEDSSAGSFNLSLCTDAYKSEFVNNSHWLKFGFHSKNGQKNYSTASKDDAKSDYNQLITELIRICGIECIDRMPRIQNYEGSKDAMTGFRDADNGIVGALAAQDTSLTEKRDSYYFTEEQNMFMHKHCKMYDFETSLTFVKTAFMSGGATSGKQYSEMLNLANDVEIFLHENQLSSSSMKNYMEKYAREFFEIGYSNSFQMYHALMR